MINFSNFKYLTKPDIHNIIDLAEKAKSSRAISESNTLNLSTQRATSEELDLLNKLKGMSFQEQIEVCALMLLGRSAKEEDSEPVDYKDLIAEADRVGTAGIVQYLFEKPLADYLREGLLKTFP